MSDTEEVSVLSNIYNQINNSNNKVLSPNISSTFNDIIKNNLSNTKKIYDIFDTVNTDDLDELEQNNKIKIKGENNICDDCNIEMLKTRNMCYECKNCGRIEECINSDIDFYNSETNNGSSDILNSYNTSDTSASAIRISGPQHYKYQKQMLVQESSYKKMQRKTTITEMLNYVYKYKGSTPPTKVVLEAAELYNQIQQHCIKRGDIRKGTMAACLYILCKMHNINRKPKEISEIFGITQDEASEGEKIINDLLSQGLIEIKKPQEYISIENKYKPEEINILAFLNRYFESLNLPNDEIGATILGRPNYKEFAFRLVKFTCSYRIAESSIISSKCTGAIFIIFNNLTDKYKTEIGLTKKKIEVDCVISKSTFSRFYQAVNAMLHNDDPKYAKVKSRLRNLFKKYSMKI